MSSSEVLGVLTPPQKELVKAWWNKVNTQQLKGLKKTIAADKNIFGVSLIESLSYSYSRISYLDEDTGAIFNGRVPIIIAKCGAFLKEQALDVEGIFRLSGNAKRISTLQTIFDTAYDGYGVQLDWQGYTVHDASNVMRRFLNYLPEPVINLEYQLLFKTTLDAEFPSLEAKIDAFQKLIERLPIVHQYLLLYLLDMLYLFSFYEETTRMDTSSLATAFAPSILTDPNDAMNPAGYKESQRVLEFLIKYQNRFTMPHISVNNNARIQNDSSISEHLYQQGQRRLSAFGNSNEFNDSINKQNSPYVRPQNSRSVTSLLIAGRSTTSLKRSNTTPSKKPGPEPFQPLFTNNINVNRSLTSLNQNNRSVGRWKSIKRVVKEQDELSSQDQVTS